MKNIKVQNMTSPRSYNNVANQFVIYTPEGEYFQSYQTVIAYKPYSSNFPIELDRNAWDYSATTGKYRNIFLGEDKKETERKIKEGIYVLTDLN